MGVYNTEPNLDLQLTATCDSSVVTGYVLTTEVVADYQINYNIDTSKYTCGDRVRIQQDKAALLILV